MDGNGLSDGVVVELGLPVIVGCNDGSSLEDGWLEAVGALVVALDGSAVSVGINESDGCSEGDKDTEGL